MRVSYPGQHMLVINTVNIKTLQTVVTSWHKYPFLQKSINDRTTQGVLLIRNYNDLTYYNQFGFIHKVMVIVSLPMT